MIQFEQATKRFGHALALNNITVALPEDKL